MSQPPVLRWAVVCKAAIDHVRLEALRLVDHLEERGQQVVLEEALGHREHLPAVALDDLDEHADIILTVGGDGTILMAQHHSSKPILAVNAGAVGFLAEVEPRHARGAIDRVIAGEYRVEKRCKLAVSHNGKRLPDATNEVTLQTSRIAKLIQFTVTVDGEVLDVLRGDGLIVSTATGSTGYAMSVGGPLLHPSVEGVVLAPIAPFRLAARPWVIPANSKIELRLLDRDSTFTEKPARVVIDGQANEPVAPGDEVTIWRAETPAQFVRLGDGFYERVRRKLVR